jgi:hypothetical protein
MTKIDPTKFSDKFVPRKTFDETKNNMGYLLGGVILVLMVGFITLLVAVLSPIIDANRFKTQTYQNLVDKITDQNSKIDNLTNKINEISPKSRNR